MSSLHLSPAGHPAGVASLCIAAAAAALAGPACAGVSKWRQYGANGDQSNYNANETTLTPANVATLVPAWTGPQWLVPADLPALQHHALYGTNQKFGLSAVTDAHGRARWSDPDAHSTCTPSLSTDGTVVTYAYRNVKAHGTGTLVAADATTGATLWTQRIEGMVNGCTSMFGNMVVVVTDKGWTQSYNLAGHRGSSLDEFTFPIDLHASGQGMWYYIVGTASRHVYQINGFEKSHRRPFGWDKPLGTITSGTAGTPRIAGSALLVSDDAGGVYALELATGVARWSVALPTAVGTAPGVTATTDTTAYAVERPAGSDADEIVALDVASGDAEWSSPLSGSDLVQSNLAVANGMVFAGTGANTCTTLAVVDAATGAPVASVPTGMPDSGDAVRCDLAVADGRVVLHASAASGPSMQVLGLPE